MPSSKASSQPRDQTQVSISHCRWILYWLSHQGSPRILEWVAYPFSRDSSWPRNWTGASCIAGGFFTSWATRVARWIYTSKLLSPESIIYIRFHSWCCIFYEFGQMCILTCLLFGIILSSFTALKSSVPHLFILPFPLTLGNSWSFYCLHSFAFLKIIYSV